MLQDLRYAFRSLRGSPGFATVAILTLALGIGANTAVFSFLNGLFLKPLPYPEPEQIVRVLERHPSGSLRGVSTLTFLDWQKQATAFQFLAGQSAGWNPTLTDVTQPMVLRGARISSSYFEVARIKPALGRLFRPDEEKEGADHVVVISNATFVNLFGGDRSILNRPIRLDGEPYTVIGVMPPGTIFDRIPANLWAPLSFKPSQMTRDVHWFGAFGRLKPGVTLEQARSEMNTIAARIAQENPTANKGWGAAVDRYQDLLMGDKTRSAVWVLMAAAALVLLSACVNLANLTLARGAARQREVAVRAALGAGRGRLVRQFLTENILLALCGGVGGVAVGYAAMKWLTSQIPPDGLPAELAINLDGRVLLFALVISVLTGVLFGIAPALQAARLDLAAVMKDGGRGATSGGSGKKWRNVLVISEVALAFILLVGSGLLMRSFFGLVDTDPGFDSTNVLTMRLATPVSQYSDVARLNGYLREVRRAVDAVPGVKETAMTSVPPLLGWGYQITFAIQGKGDLDPSQRPRCFIKMVSPSYFHSLGIKLKEGRGLTDQDVSGSPPVLLINDVMAQRYFPNENPVGQHLIMPQVKPGKNEFGPDMTWEVAGVIAGEKIDALDESGSPGVYISTEQVPFYSPVLVVRAGMSPRLVEAGVRRAVASVNKDQAVSDVLTMDEIRSQSMVESRVETILLGAFAATALLLAALGIYGAISYSVAQRTGEMGIRSALGASAGNLLRLVLGSGLTLAIAGLIIGAAGALAVTSVMASMLFGIGPRDPMTMVAVGVLLLAVSLLACYIPARRATKIEPLIALRHD